MPKKFKCQCAAESSDVSCLVVGWAEHAGSGVVFAGALGHVELDTFGWRRGGGGGLGRHSGG